MQQLHGPFPIYLYLTHLGNMLPCEKCRQHYGEYLKNKPLHFFLHNRESLFHWLLGLHNKSNKDIMIQNEQDAIAMYLPKIDAIQQQEDDDNKKIKSIKNKCTSCS